LNPYAANPDIRDYSGKRAMQYLPQTEMDSPDEGRYKETKSRIEKSSSFIRGLGRASFMKPGVKHHHKFI